MDKFVDKDGKVVLVIEDNGTEKKDEKYFADKKCGHETKCGTCEDKEESE
jgi:hypothetical protein